MKMILVVIILFSAEIICQQTDSLLHYTLGEIEIYAKRDNSSGRVEADKKDFELHNAFTVYEALGYVPGLSFFISGKNEAQLSFRGYDQRQISVMIDGAPVYLPFDGSFDLNSGGLAGFSKISVATNYSILYGPNSMGGSINMVSQLPEKDISGSLNFQGGSSQKLIAGVAGKLKGFDYTAALGYSERGNFKLPGSFGGSLNEKGPARDNSSGTSKSGLIKIRTNLLNKTDLAFALNFSFNKKDVPVNIHTAFPRYWRYGKLDNMLANFMYASALSSEVVLKGNIFYETYKNELDSYDDASFITQFNKYAFHSVYNDHSYGVNISSFIQGSFLPLTKIIFLYKRDQHNEQADYQFPFKKYEAEIFTGGLEETFSFSTDMKAVAGVSYDKMIPLYADGSSLRPAGSALNGNISLSVNSGNSGVGLSASGKTRFPTLKEFYAELIGSYLPNNKLSPERGYNLEITGFTEFSDLILRTSLFYSYIRDLIEVVYTGTGARQFTNLSECALRGIETDIEYHMTPFNVRLNGVLLSARNLTSDDPVPGRPGIVSNIILFKEYEQGFEWGTESSYQAYRYSLNPDSNQLVKLSGYFILNGKIAQRIFTNYKIYFRVNNITDKYYESEYGFPQPGREYYAGISAEW